MAFSIHGASAELRHAYLVAATLGPWRIQDGGFAAPVLSSNPVQLARVPLDLVLSLGKQRFKVENVDAQIADGRCTVAVPPGCVKEC